jgi:hypothetical protein
MGVTLTSLSFNHGHNKIFLIPYSCKATERNGNDIHADVTVDTNEND